MPNLEDNLARFAPGALGAYEVWYLIVEDLSGRNAFWIRYTSLSPGLPQAVGECALWFVRFSADHPERNLGIKQSYPTERYLPTGPPGFRVKIGDASLDDGSAQGSVTTADHELSWDLKFFSGGETYYPIPERLRRSRFARSTVLVPHWNGLASGEVRVDGNVFSLRRAPITQAHIFGRRYNPGWVWAHGNAFRDRPDVVAEALGARLRVAGIPSPSLTSFGCAGIGRQHATRSVRALLRNRARLQGTPPKGPFTGIQVFGRGGAGASTPGNEDLVWTVESRGEDGDYRWEIRARIRDLAVLEYVGPAGERLNCYNSCVADSRLTFRPHSGGAEQVFVSEHSTAFEVTIPV